MSATTIVKTVLDRNRRNIQRKAGSRSLESFGTKGDVGCEAGKMVVAGQVVADAAGNPYPCATANVDNTKGQRILGIASAMGLPAYVLGMEQLPIDDPNRPLDEMKKILIGNYIAAASQFLDKYVPAVEANQNSGNDIVPMRKLTPPFVNDWWQCLMAYSMGKQIDGNNTIAKFDGGSPVAALVQNMVITNELQSVLNDISKYVMNGTKSMLIYGTALSLLPVPQGGRRALKFQPANSKPPGFQYSIEQAPGWTVNEKIPGMKTASLSTERKAATTALENWAAMQVSRPTRTIITWNSNKSKFSILFKLGQANSLNHSLLDVYRLHMYDILDARTNAAVKRPGERPTNPSAGGVVQTPGNVVADAMLFGDVDKLEKAYPKTTIGLFSKPTNMSTADMRKCNRAFWKFIGAGGSPLARMALVYFMQTVVGAKQGTTVGQQLLNAWATVKTEMVNAVSQLPNYCDINTGAGQPNPEPAKGYYRDLAAKQVRRFEKDLIEEINCLTSSEVAPFSNEAFEIGKALHVMSVAFLNRKLAASIIPPDKEDASKMDADEPDLNLAQAPVVRIFADEVGGMSMAPQPLRLPFGPEANPNLIAAAIGSRGAKSALALQQLRVADEQMKEAVDAVETVARHAGSVKSNALFTIGGIAGDFGQASSSAADAISASMDVGQDMLNELDLASGASTPQEQAQHLDRAAQLSAKSSRLQKTIDAENSKTDVLGKAWGLTNQAMGAAANAIGQFLGGLSRPSVPEGTWSSGAPEPLELEPAPVESSLSPGPSYTQAEKDRLMAEAQAAHAMLRIQASSSGASPSFVSPSVIQSAIDAAANVSEDADKVVVESVEAKDEVETGLNAVSAAAQQGAAEPSAATGAPPSVGEAVQVAADAVQTAAMPDAQQELRDVQTVYGMLKAGAEVTNADIERGYDMLSSLSTLFGTTRNLIDRTDMQFQTLVDPMVTEMENRANLIWGEVLVNAARYNSALAIWAHGIFDIDTGLVAPSNVKFDSTRVDIDDYARVAAESMKSAGDNIGQWTARAGVTIPLDDRTNVKTMAFNALVELSKHFINMSKAAIQTITYFGTTTRTLDNYKIVNKVHVTDPDIMRPLFLIIPEYKRTTTKMKFSGMAARSYVPMIEAGTGKRVRQVVGPGGIATVEIPEAESTEGPSVLQGVSAVSAEPAVLPKLPETPEPKPVPAEAVSPSMVTAAPSGSPAIRTVEGTNRFRVPGYQEEMPSGVNFQLSMQERVKKRAAIRTAYVRFEKESVAVMQYATRFADIAGMGTVAQNVTKANNVIGGLMARYNAVMLEGVKQSAQANSLSSWLNRIVGQLSIPVLSEGELDNLLDKNGITKLNGTGVLEQIEGEISRRGGNGALFSTSYTRLSREARNMINYLSSAIKTAHEAIDFTDENDPYFGKMISNDTKPAVAANIQKIFLNAKSAVQ